MPDESSPTVIKPKRDYATIAAQVTLGALGLGAGALYVGPAMYVARSSDMGIWLSNLVSEDAAIVIFTAGGADYASINAYFSSKSVQSFKDYVDKQKSTRAKIGKGGLIILYALTQEASLFLTSSITSSSVLETVITVAGGAPSAMYAGVGMMESELPYLISKVKQVANNIRYSMVDRFYSLTPEEQLFRQQVKHYQKQYELFMSQIETQWAFIESHASTVALNPDASALDKLFDPTVQGTPKTFWQHAVHRFGELTGIALTTNYTAAFVMSTFQGLTPFVPYLPLRIFLTAVLNSSSVYGNIKIGSHGMTNILDNVFNLLNGKPVESLAFQLRPKTSAAVAVALLPMSVLSYTVADFLFLKQFPGANVGARKILRYTADASMSFYHYAGLFHFYTLVLSLVSKDKQEQALFSLQHEVEKMQKMTLSEFTEFAKQNDAEINARYGIQPPAALPAPHVESAEEIERDFILVEPTDGPEPQAPAPVSGSKWFSWFKGKEPERQPLLVAEELVKGLGKA